MSVLREMAGKRFWIGQILTMLTVLALTGLGALLGTSGMVALDKAWLCVCFAWAAAGLFSARYGASTGGCSMLRGIVSILITMALMWAIGLTTPEQGSHEILRWPWYVGSGLAGAVIAVALPRKQKRRKTTAKGRGKTMRK